MHTIWWFRVCLMHFFYELDIFFYKSVVMKKMQRQNKNKT